MKRFEIQLLGRNFLLDFDGDPRKYRFHATRFVRANDAEAAGKMALIQFHQHSDLIETALNAGTDPPVLEVETVEEIGWLRFLRRNALTALSFQAESD